MVLVIGCGVIGKVDDDGVGVLMLVVEDVGELVVKE